VYAIPPAARRRPGNAQPVAAAPPSNEFTFEVAWRDTAGRVRTWRILDPAGQRIGEVTTKRAARALLDQLNR
jgi:hypothetical protein